MTPRASLTAVVSALVAISCGTSSATATREMTKSGSVLGLDDDVRVEAIIHRDPLRPYSSVKVICEIENRRAEPIIVYLSETLPIYDPNTRTFTVNVGAEIPESGSQPIQILSAERRTFEQVVSLQGVPPLLQRMGSVIRVRLHFLLDAIGFGSDENYLDLDVIEWAEQKRTVDTNTIPVY